MKQSHLTPLTCVVLLLIALCAVVIAPSSAAGAAQQPITGRQASQPTRPHPFLSRQNKPEIAAINPNSNHNLVFHGGSVLENNESLYAIFWEPTNNVEPGYNDLIQRFLGDFGVSPLYQIAHQYGDYSLLAPTGARFAGAWIDNGAYPQNPLYDGNIQQEVTHAQQVNGWPQTSPNNIFFVFTQSNEVICMDASSPLDCTNTGVCGWHNIFNSEIVYAAIPYVANNGGCNPGRSPNFNDADWSINVASHEEIETSTDPQLHAWTDTNGNEISDKCAWMFGAIDAQGGNTVLNGHEYMTQEAWDNYTASCRMSPSSTILPGTWPICTYENGTCSIFRQETIAFGNNGGYSYFDLTPRPLGCNNGTLGDPNAGTYKTCYVEDVPPGNAAWSFCTGENSTCVFNGSTMTVAYGANGQFHYGTITSGVACNNSTFGDPAPGIVKSCYLMAPPPGTVTWTQCASDNGTCFFPGNGGTHEVAYGANGQYVYRSVTATSVSGVPCSTSVWGDPNPGVAKACYWASTGI